MRNALRGQSSRSAPSGRGRAKDAEGSHEFDFDEAIDPHEDPSLFGRFRALSWKLKLLSLAVVPVVLFYAGALLLSLFNYAVGERTGVLSKISKKGVACWTTEGELAQPSFSKSGALRSGNAPIDNTFYFSVPNPDVRKQLDAVAGKLRVAAI